MADIDPNTAWDEICQQENERNWMLLDTEMKVVGSGTGGLSEFKDNLDDNQVMFGAFVVYGVDDRGSTVSKRTKTVFVVWIGSGVGALSRGKALRSKSDASNIFLGHNLSVDIDDRDDLTQKVIADSLLKAGGAHKPGSYDFGPDQEYVLS